MITIPAEDQVTFHRLPLEARNEVIFWRGVVNEVIACTLGVVKALESVAAARRLSYSTVRAQYYRAIKLGWRGLVNGRRVGDNKAAVNPEFLDYWHGLVLANGRNTTMAFRRLVQQYHRKEVIPGMPAPDERGHSLPRGYGERNLVRPKYLPPKASIVMARQGIAAARAHLPHGPQDISHIRPLEWVVFDDVEVDFLVIVVGITNPVKLRLLVAMDLCSRVILGYGVRPAIPREDGVEDGLKLRDMKAVVARLLRTWGVPVGYQMHFVCERATAALPDAAKAALAEISGGQIVVHDTSMIVGQVFEFRDKASGNSWGKAWLESFFNKLHGELADLPGQKGRRYDLAPAELDVRRKELAQLVKLGKRLPLELRYTFQWPFKTVSEAMQELDAAFARLHAREDHGLLCFDRVALWRTSENDTPKPESEMPEWLIPQSANLLWETRVESPMERFNRLLDPNRQPVADCGLQRLMDEQKRVRFADLQFAFEREKTDYIYLPPDALLPLLVEGSHYILWFHPADMGTVYVTRDRPHLGYIGKLTRFTAGRKGDLEDAKSYLKEKKRLFEHAAKAAQQSGTNRIRSQGDAYAANTEVLANFAALEVEVDVVQPGTALADNADAPESVRVMTTEIATEAAERAAVGKIDMVKETLARPRVARPDAADAWS